MAVNGTTTVVVRSPEYLEVTWAVTTPVVNNYSDAINVRGYEIIEYYVSVYTGYTGATLTIGVLADMAQAVEGDGLIAESAGRHLRAELDGTGITNHQAGYLIAPPPSIRISVGAHDGASTAITVRLTARPLAARRALR